MSADREQAAFEAAEDADQDKQLAEDEEIEEDFEENDDYDDADDDRVNFPEKY